VRVNALTQTHLLSETQEQYTMLKQISLAAALAVTAITGSAAVAYAEGDAGINEAPSDFSTSAALERDERAGAFASYGYAPEPGVPQSSKKQASHAKMKHASYAKTKHG
jgi:hypothetical protein